MRVDPYLMFSGNCEEAFNVYAAVLGGKIEMMLPHEGTPAESTMPAEWKKKILHASLLIGDQRLLASDAPPGRQAPMSGFAVTLNVASVAEVERIFAGLSTGATVTMPPQATFFAKSFAMLTDRFSTPWMLICSPEPQA